MASSAESSIYDPTVVAGFVQLSREAAVSVRTRSRNCDKMSGMLGHDKKRNSLLVGAKEGTEGF